MMKGVEMIQRLGKEKQGEDIESRLKAKVEELDAERKEKENKEKWELVEKIEKIKEDLIENRENVEVFLRLADTYEKGIEEESKIEEIRKFVKKNSKYLEELMIKKIKEVKETGKELGSDTIENSSWMIDSYKKKIDRCKRELKEIIRQQEEKIEKEILVTNEESELRKEIEKAVGKELDKEKEIEGSKEVEVKEPEEENKQIAEIECMSKTEVEEESEITVETEAELEVESIEKIGGEEK